LETAKQTEHELRRKIVVLEANKMVVRVLFL
jgi:hypothetical protein